MFARKKAPAPSLRRQQMGLDVGRRLDANPDMVRAEVSGIQIYYQLDFLNFAQCDTLIATIDANRRPSSLLSDRNDPDFRTSDSCDMNRYAPEVQPTDEAIAALLGLPPEHGETLQGQRYAPGQRFRAHHDYFHETESYWQQMQASGGQRTWTTMIYLNDVAEGGATWFPQAGFKVAPRRGLLLAWNNMNPDGTPNVQTLHEGTAVVEGTKYIVTKWFRENAWLKR
ncbi:2OG-Fe(II) oxygenase [Sphingomonadaceae bacterium OTU29MARTA1]|uniref:2OG-Fe(II) oxygenase n=1 Tax=Sphingomonas sp. Leaf37 TaxID=2876552 RepID=UPI001E63FEA0|nr:2OG-Fe(II) oxygenase [Sphingomonas sp. Leaf37]USU08986.1 2OG-Fe(II) oxygenase [Sphingomonadaceae bacterium OTU29MARTA1]